MKKLLSIALICVLTVGALLPSFTAKAEENDWYIDGRTLHIKSSWQGGKVFEGGTKLTHDDIRRGITEVVFDDTVKPLTLQNAFVNFDSLEKIDFTNVDFSEVVSLESMLEGCHSIKMIDLRDKDMRNVKTMKNAFKSCTSIKTLSLENLKTDSLEDMESVFENVDSVEQISIKNINTSKVTNMAKAFYDCCSYGHTQNCLDLTSFDTSNVTNMSGMFERCMAREIDLSSFNVSRVTDMTNMFKNAQNVYTIYASNDFVAEANSDGMFEGNWCLVGRQDDFDKNNLGLWKDNETQFGKYGNKGIEFAKINREGGDGYFTYKEAPKQYTVTYDLNGAQGNIPEPQTVKPGETFEVTTNISRDAFIGWTDGVNTYQPGDIYTADESDVTLKAIWNEPEAVIEENGDVIAKGTFEEMLAGATEEETVRLVKDVEINTPNTNAASLDLNGHTLKADKLAFIKTQVIDTSKDSTGTLICDDTHFAKSDYIPMYAKAQYSFDGEVVTPGWHFYKLEFLSDFGGYFNPKNAPGLGSNDDNDYGGVKMGFRLVSPGRKAFIILANEDISEAGLKLTIAPFMAIPNRGELAMLDDEAAYKDESTMIVGDEILKARNVKFYTEAQEGTHPSLLAKRGADLRGSIKALAKNILNRKRDDGGVILYGTWPNTRIWACYARFKFETNDFIICENEVQHVEEDYLRYDTAHTLTYDLGDCQGTAPEPQHFTVGENFIIKGNIMHTVFEGWTDGERLYKPGDTYHGGKTNVTLKAVWNFDNIKAILKENDTVIAEGTLKEMSEKAKHGQSVCPIDKRVIFGPDGFLLVWTY